MKNEYDQPEKSVVRKRVLRAAVRNLTVDRAEAPVVTRKVITETLEYCCSYIERATGSSVANEVEGELRKWWPIYSSNVGRKKPEDLHVLILSGPKPSNDALCLQELGVPAENIWAVEGESRITAEAQSDLRKRGLAVKLHTGSLHEFFELIPQRFDIVYFDACGPLLGGKPGTWPVLRELLVQQRLAPLSALITTFCSAESTHEVDTWAQRIACWFAPRSEEPVEFSEHTGERIADTLDSDISRGYLQHVRSHMGEYSGEFVTRFTTEGVAKMVPWWRLLALTSAKRQLFADGKFLDDALASSTKLEDPFQQVSAGIAGGHAVLAPDAYPNLWTAKLLTKLLKPDDPFRVAFERDTLRKEKLGRAISIMDLATNFFESIAGWADHNRDACSQELQELLVKFRWFDSAGSPWSRMFCDIPLPHLVTDLIVGQLGYPFHVNIAKLDRFSYTARENRMLTDSFVLDQARYLYDAAPSIPMFATKMSVGRQMILRTCMDGIWRHTRSSCPHLFWACSLAGLGEGGFRFHEWPDRQQVRS